MQYVRYGTYDSTAHWIDPPRAVGVDFEFKQECRSPRGVRQEFMSVLGRISSDQQDTEDAEPPVLPTGIQPL